MKLQFPLLSAVVFPKELKEEPITANNSTVLPASAVPVNVGVLSLVRLSLLELPVSELVARSGLDGVVVAVAVVVEEGGVMVEAVVVVVTGFTGVVLVGGWWLLGDVGGP